MEAYWDYYGSKPIEEGRHKFLGDVYGAKDFLVGTTHCIAGIGSALSMPFYYAPRWALGMSTPSYDWKNFQASHRELHQVTERWMQHFLPADIHNTSFKNRRENSSILLETASTCIGGAGLIKTGWTVAKRGYTIMREACNSKWIQQGIRRFSRDLKDSTQLGVSTEQFINRGLSFAGRRYAPLDYAPYQKIRNSQTIINGRKYSGHALDRMQDRGYTPSVIENVLNTGKAQISELGVVNYYDPINRIKVVVSKGGQIITIIPGRG
jgi:hypothetical protein